jgi:ankyrin repeat protein
MLIKYFNNSLKNVVLITFISFFNCCQAGSYEDFFRALQFDDLKVVSSLLNRGFDPNTVNLDAEPALIAALREGSIKTFEVLVKHPKINLNIRNQHGESALMLACIKGHLPMARLLIKREADVNHPGWTALHYAASGGHTEIIRLLLDENAYIDAESPNGTTPLMMAARYGNSKAVQLLIEEGSDIQLKNQLGLGAIDFAKQGNRPDSLSLLEAALNKLNLGKPGN